MYLIGAIILALVVLSGTDANRWPDAKKGGNR